MNRMQALSKKNGLVFLKVKVITGGSNNLICGSKNNELVVKINAPAVKNKANKELIYFLARTFSIAKTQIQIHSGARSRHKTITIPLQYYDELVKKI